MKKVKILICPEWTIIEDENKGFEFVHPEEIEVVIDGMGVDLNELLTLWHQTAR